MRLDTKMCLSSVLMAAVCGGSGIYGIMAIDEEAALLSGPAFQTADGAMMTQIEVERQMLAVQGIINDVDTEANNGQLVRAREDADGNLGRSLGAKLLDEKTVKKTQAERANYEASLSKLLESKTKLNRLRAEFESEADVLRELTGNLEEVADSAVGSIENKPDEPITWNNGLATRWNAADGAMESRIGLLSQIVLVERLRTGMPFDQFDKEFRETAAFQKEAMQMMVESKFFLTPHDPKQPNGPTTQQVYQEHQAKLNQAIEAYAAQFKEFAALNKSYQSQCKSFLEMLDVMEEEADKTVDAAADVIAETKFRAWLTIAISLMASVAASVIGAVLMARRITRPLQATVQTLDRLAHGDLTQRVSVNATGEVGQVVTAVNQIAESFQQTVKKLLESTSTLAGASETMASTAAGLAGSAAKATEQSSSAASAAEEMSSRITSISSSTGQVSASVSHVAKAVQEITQSISEVSRSAEQSATISQHASTLAATSNQQIEALSRATAEISGFIEVIQDIADQTNLLALNATIESARAGQAGKGFAVVANEVKELAAQSRQATNDIRQRITSMQHTSEQVISTITEVSKVIGEVNGAAQSIASAVEQQSIAAKSVTCNIGEIATAATMVATGVSETATASVEISSNIVGLDHEARRTAEGATNANLASEELSGLVTDLRQVVGNFTV